MLKKKMSINGSQWNMRTSQPQLTQHNAPQEIFWGLILLSGLMDFNSKIIWPVKTQSLLLLNIKKAYFYINLKIIPLKTIYKVLQKKKKPLIFRSIDTFLNIYFNITLLKKTTRKRSLVLSTFYSIMPCFPPPFACPFSEAHFRARTLLQHWCCQGGNKHFSLQPAKVPQHELQRKASGWCNSKDCCKFISCFFFSYKLLPF